MQFAAIKSKRQTIFQKKIFTRKNEFIMDLCFVFWGDKSSRSGRKFLKLDLLHCQNIARGDNLTYSIFMTGDERTLLGF